MRGDGADHDAFWVFGYGSLMWRPGFDYEEALPALLRGYHRTCCIYSIRYRGTPDRPGLVMGLDRGGSCRGRAFRVADENVDRVRTYLDGREMATGVYTPRHLNLKLDDGRTVTALTFVARHDHPQYAGQVEMRRAAELIVQGEGCRGTDLEYMVNTVAHLDELGITDTRLHRVVDLALEMAGGDKSAFQKN